MNVLVTGSGGLIGSALLPALRAAGWNVLRAVRRQPEASDEVRWDTVSGLVEGPAGPQAAVHLAGVGLDHGRWTLDRKREIERSRIHATHGLCEWLARRPAHPSTLVAASAIGYYGDQGDRPLEESSPPGSGWLAGVVERWEKACEPAHQAGIRVVHLRFGLVLARQGGALPPMIRLFRLGLGGPLGGGRQFWSWISLPDVVAVIRRSLEDPSFSGPLNVVAPEPLRQADFARALGLALRRPAVLPAPSFAIRAVLGEMADTLVLSSARVLPSRLRQRGYEWRHPDLAEALRHALAS